jgi:hypothetical protein
MQAGNAIERIVGRLLEHVRCSNVWIAPGLLSTTTRQPSLSASSFAMMRHTISGGVSQRSL